MRKGIADHMRSSIASTAQLSFFLEVDVTDVQQMRRDASKDSDTTITLAHAIIKACAAAISRVPAINSILSEGTVHQFDEVNIGFAAALDEGLIVPVIRGVEQKSISEIAAEMDELATKAKDGTLLPDAVLGGTFTVSVLGIVDWLYAHPQRRTERHPRRWPLRTEARREEGRSRRERDAHPEPDG